jgi:hypothetical protein
VRRNEILCNIGGQSVMFVHTIVISTHVSRVALVRAYQKTPNFRAIQ